MNLPSAGSRLRGVIPDRVVTILGVTPIDDDLLDLTYRDDDGRTASRLATGADLASFIDASDEGSAFDADPADFVLAAEALRMRRAAFADPMAAVNSSGVDPLPHQLRAVYGEMLPRVPLRFLLADDPGAGKTIMAGLYLKELVLRSDCESALIVAPGGLVEQWREELCEKFDLHFEVFERHMIDAAAGSNPFADHPFLVARMDQLSRNDDLREQLAQTHWDVVIVDEAHRMSAHYSSWAGEVDETQRFRLGRLLSEIAHNFLLMTATPHAGKEEDFQLFMSLLDRDRFEGQFRQGVHRTDTAGLMRRMVKEDLLTFEGRPLFPERRAFTVEFELSDAERELYERVTEYVRTEMGRAQRLADAGEGRRGNNVGFALTVLQRRLASSPEAILRSLERRRERLGAQAREIAAGVHDLGDSSSAFSVPVQQWDDVDLDDLSESERAEWEQQAEHIADLATAAQTLPELRAEIAVLDQLVEAAKRVRNSNEDRKWTELREILDAEVLATRTGEIRKLIVFTEHRDTLEYLRQRISAHLGRGDDAVLTIHGGTPRDARREVREAFTHDPVATVLLATDAAGEGLNLQRAHLMVNYDLPWNPNRIEQRFGRVHRIGQTEVCQLWNLVARDTREGDVFVRLLDKIAQMSKAYSGSLFNVLGEGDAFQELSLRELLVEAIRYGDRTEVRERLNRIIDAGVAHGLEEVRAEQALHDGIRSGLDLAEERRRMELARERRLQPGYVAAFFLSAFRRLGGVIRERGSGMWEIVRVPARVRERARIRDRWAPVAERYERVTFDTAIATRDSDVRIALIAPGSPLLAAVVDLTLDDLGGALRRGTVFVDRRAGASGDASAMFAVEQSIRAGGDAADVLSMHVDYPVLDGAGEITVPASPPYLDVEAPTGIELPRARAIAAAHARTIGDQERAVRAKAFRAIVQPRMAELAERTHRDTLRTRTQVTARLNAEINYWDREYARLDDLERGGTTGRIRASAARERSRTLEERLERRLAQLDAEEQLIAEPAVITGRAIVVPESLLAPHAHSFDVAAREAVERRAVEAVLAAERALGREPVEMARNNPGFDVRSTDATGRAYFIEVKGRIHGSDTFTITSNEVSFAQTQGPRHRLALVSVAPEGPAGDELRYVDHAFDHIEPSASTRSFNEVWAEYWARGNAAH